MAYYGEMDICSTSLILTYYYRLDMESRDFDFNYRMLSVQLLFVNEWVLIPEQWLNKFQTSGPNSKEK